MLSPMSWMEILILLFPNTSDITPAFFRATSVRSSSSVDASYSQPPLYTHKFLLFMCLDLHFVLSNFIPFLLVYFRNPQIFCHQAKGNTWLFGRSYTTSKWIVPMPHVDNLVLGFHLASHTPSFPCPFTLSYILYYLIVFSCRIKQKGKITQYFFSLVYLQQQLP